VVRYRDFLHEIEPRFSVESLEYKKLATLVKQITDLDAISDKFLNSLRREAPPSATFSVYTDQAIQKHLHEMNQPLATKKNMLVEAEAALKLIDKLDEIGSYSPYVMDYVGNNLSKAMKADWKYHVLQEIPLFHQLYDIHQHLVEPIDDRQHLNRMNLFKKMIEKLENWVKEHETLKHTHEIELDINDMKGYLQDFLARVQRMARETVDKEEAIQNISNTNRKLLDYRYLFAKFFHGLSQNNPEEKLLRKQLLFIDQYFETIEARLREMREAYELF
jgi:hypothetical protein